MHSRFVVGTIALLVGGLTASGAAAADDVNANVGIAFAGAGVENVVENHWDLYMGGDETDGSAASNCQFLLGVQTVVISLAAVDHLGLISDSDSFNGDFLFGRSKDIVVSDQDSEVFVDNATATCEQHVGPVGVFLRSSDGFGEAAPMGDMASALNEGRGGDANVNFGLGFTESRVNDVVSNEAYAELDGDGSAAANCQILVAWQTAVVSAALVSQEGTITDDDAVDIITGGPNEILITEDDQKIRISAGHASCIQTVESIDLHLGDDAIPPQS